VGSGLERIRVRVELLDTDGQTIWSQSGEINDVSSTGAILYNDISNEAQTLRLAYPTEESGPGETLDWAPSDFISVEFSTDGQRLAFTTWAEPGGPVDMHLDVYDTEGTRLDRALIPWRTWDIQWSHDDRYILMPGSDNQGSHAVVFYDRHTEIVSAVDDFQDWVQWADLRDPHPAP
jgi:hypothetical protein